MQQVRAARFGIEQGLAPSIAASMATMSISSAAAVPQRAADAPPLPPPPLSPPPKPPRVPIDDGELTTIIHTEGRGRGLAATKTLPAGTAVLCEPALASADLKNPHHNPWMVAATLVNALLKTPGAVEVTKNLEPRNASGQVVPPGESKQVEQAVTFVQKKNPQELSEGVEELLAEDEATRLLHVVVRNSLQLCGLQALCPRVAMINHSCTPNAVHLGYKRVGDGRLCCCIRAVREIKKGDEITISYISDLASSVEDRSNALYHHGFKATERPCDALLVEWKVPIQEEDADEQSKKREAIGACNMAADAAWTVAHAAGKGATEAVVRRKGLMEAASHYAKLLQLANGVLGERHGLLLVARGRLAKVMQLSGAERSRANAMPLWKAVLAVMRPCVPTRWPQLLEPLRGLADAAEAAGDDETELEAREEVDALLRIIRPDCGDVVVEGVYTSDYWFR